MPLNGTNLLGPVPVYAVNSTLSNPAIVPSTTTNQQFCLRWTNYHSNLSTVCDQLYQNESFVDVTLVSEGRPIKAHKMVLAASSPYFQTIFNETPCKHPIVIIKDVKYEELKALVDFMYRGEVNVAQEQIRPLLKLAEMFQIRGLTDVSHDEDSLDPSMNNPVEQFTIYAAFNNEESPQDMKTTVEAAAKRRSSKERELSRKQNLETLDVPVEWPAEEDINNSGLIKLKNCRKRKSTSDFSTVDETAINNFEPNNAFQNLPVVVPAPTVMIAPPPPPVLPTQPTTLTVPVFQPEDTDSKMSFLDSTNEDTSAANSPEWASTNDSRAKQKAPTWNWTQLQEAINAVVTQRLRFTQASAQYSIPKGTLYDNILGKSHRMAVLQDLALNPAEEAAVLDFCCDTSISPYNKRTKKSLQSILQFLARFDAFRAKEDKFRFGGKGGFRWWWAFCRKHSIVSLYYEGMKQDDQEQDRSARFAAPKRERKSVELDSAGIA